MRLSPSIPLDTPSRIQCPLLTWPMKYCTMEPEKSHDSRYRKAVIEPAGLHMVKLMLLWRVWPSKAYCSSEDGTEIWALASICGRVRLALDLTALQYLETEPFPNSQNHSTMYTQRLYTSSAWGAACCSTGHPDINTESYLPLWLTRGIIQKPVCFNLV